MARETVVLRWCDPCMLDGKGRVEATHTYTVGIVEGESRPQLYLLEVCDEHDTAVLDLRKVVTDSAPVPPREQPAAPVRVNPQTECRVCGATISRGGLVGHVWSAHRRGQQRAEPGMTKCPECRQNFDTSLRMHGHRKAEHGRTQLDDAYEGLTLKH